MEAYNRITIAIDGPAGAGKSTIAKIISKTLKILYLDTGAMYRTVALKAIREGIDSFDRDRLSDLVSNIDVKIIYTANDEQRILLDGEDVSSLIRTSEVSRGASNVAVIPEVRLKMVELQREIALNNSVVMDGRDIGTYVLPDANYKFFLTASIEERAKRRFEELKAKGVDITLEQVKEDILYRDKNDSSRDFAPLCKASDAVEIDTTHFSIEEVANKILEYIENHV